MSLKFYKLLPLVLFFAAITTGAEVDAQTPNSTILDLGFLPLDSLHLPEPVRIASESVVRLVTRADLNLPLLPYSLAETEHLLEFCRVENPTFLQLKNCEALRECLSLGGHKAETIPYLMAVGFQPEERVCYRPYNDGGSGFVISKGSATVKILTNYHVINEPNAAVLGFLQKAIQQYPAEERLRLTRHLALSFEIYDQHGQLIQEVRSQEMKIAEMGDVLGPDVAETSGIRAIGHMLEDFAVLEFQPTAEFPQALKAAQEPPQQNELLFAVGFADPTQGRVHNSDGFHQSISPGLGLSAKDFFESVQAAVSPQDGLDQLINLQPNYSLPSRGLVYSNADVVSGMSGGPLLNAQGEVVALVVKSFASAEQPGLRAVMAIYFSDLGL